MIHSHQNIKMGRICCGEKITIFETRKSGVPHCLTFVGWKGIPKALIGAFIDEDALDLRYSSFQTDRIIFRQGNEILRLTCYLNRLNMISVNETYSTKQAAKRIGVHWVTLHKWRSAGKVSASVSIGMNGGRHWRWTVQDIDNALRYKQEHYRKGRGRKKKKTGAKKIK